jgi:glucose-6-phosphate-specific signal transduction histidine kinase
MDAIIFVRLLIFFVLLNYGRSKEFFSLLCSFLHYSIKKFRIHAVSDSLNTQPKQALRLLPEALKGKFKVQTRIRI